LFFAADPNMLMQHLRPTHLLILTVFCGALATSPVAAQEQSSADATVNAENMKLPSGEYEGQLPPLIDRQTFFGDPQRSSAQISPDGEHVSFIKPYKGVMNVWVKERGEPFDAAEPVTADTTRPVPGYFWTQDSERILYVQDKGGNENFHIYAVTPDADEETDLGVPPAEDLTPYEDVRARIVDVPESTPGEIIVGLNDRNPQYHDVYRIDLATGERTLIRENNANVAAWTTDLDGNLRLATRQTDDGGSEVLRVEADTLVSVYKCSFEETCSPVRFHKDGERVYMQTNKGPDVDLTRLVLFNPQTQATEVVASDPENEVNFGGAIFNDRTDELAATVYADERQRVYPQTDAFEQKYETLKSELPDGELSIQSSTQDFRTHVVSVSRDVNPGATYLFDGTNGTAEKLYESRPELPTQHLAAMRPITYEARDGLEIPAYLTLPPGAAHENLPVIVFPHGGPWARDTWGYNSFAQFFANRGYAVLQPNFRGSTGYGQEFLNAGNEEWGTGAMQHDITDGVQYLIDQGIADPDRVGITGISYGGYATLAGLTFTPDVYAAGASYVGPSNLITLLNSIPPYWAPLKKTFDKRVGDPDDEDDRERLKKQSPFFHAENIDDPLLVIQGANDPRVKKQESDQIVVAARENDVPTQYMVAPEEGHGFRKENNRLAVAARMERFFGQHLGGRYQTDAAPEVQERLDALAVDPNSVTLPDTTATADASDAPSGIAMMDGSELEPATLSYDATMEMQGRSIDLSSVRRIAAASTDGTETWTVVGETETPRATVIDSMIIDRSTLRPVSRHQRGPITMDVTYTDTSASGEITMRGQSTSVSQQFDRPTLAGGAHDLLALSTMPLEPGFSTSLPVFSARQQTVQTARFEVTGTETVETPAGTFEAYVVDVTVGDDKVSGTVHLRAEGPHHVVKSELEQSTPRGTQTITQTLSRMDVPTSSADTQ
jgi:dipeptidyl aminopeptidase/acylaminoacyl peptidase